MCFIIFFWPTSLNQTFKLFSCREVGNLQNTYTNVLTNRSYPIHSYLMADFEEPCFVGRHMVVTVLVRFVGLHCCLVV